MFGHLVADQGLVVDGVEANPAWADMARPLYRNVWASFVEDAPLPDREYQLVVCGDILEHTPDPVNVLKRLRQASADDATFIISVPNIAHVGVRMMLLAGRFPKMERGPLDRTHLQFFTKDTARDMVEAAGLTVERTTTTGVPLDEVWKKGEGSAFYKLATKCQHAALAVAPRLFGFQWIMVCKNSPAAATATAGVRTAREVDAPSEQRAAEQNGSHFDVAQPQPVGA